MRVQQRLREAMAREQAAQVCAVFSLGTLTRGGGGGRGAMIHTHTYTHTHTHTQNLEVGIFFYTQ